ncbi:MAG: alpha/beta hydrolase [Dehalococcoides mccartyi]|uniref:alpha/beta fold hydrolase n=2 Tax=Dehalococcoides mccartyi TaxID=61435 RepID=UPI00242AFB02|nr:alpha/beta hydrolase [Dehalococcoides mccartyi]MCF7635766.1 alpha/beta hydrolase [Dehalococcoides mccartyi]MEA2121874.1 AB hydrolase superfamily protein YdjP [Dehalococcoides mccartyi]
MTAENEFAPQIARLPGVDLSYREAGSGPALVFMHAGITDSRSWHNQLCEFAKDYHVIAPDMRGYGQSVITGDIFNYYRDVLELLHLLRIDKAVLAGNSVGGTYALDLALLHPDMVSALVLVDPCMRGYRNTDEKFLDLDRQLEELISLGQKTKAIELYLQIWLVGNGRTDADIDKGVYRLCKKMLEENYQAVVGGKREQRLKRPEAEDYLSLKIPTLVLVGEHDVPDMHTIGDRFVKSIPRASFQEIKQAGHLPALEKPAEFNSLLREFLGQNGL